VAELKQTPPKADGKNRMARQVRKKVTPPSVDTTTKAVTTRPAQSPAEASAPRHAPKRPASIKPVRERRKLGPVLRFINALLTIVVLALLGLGGAAAYLQSSLDAPGPLTQSKLVVIPRGEETQSIADRLERDGVVSNRNSFVASYYWAQFTAKYSGGKPVSLKAGDYEVKPGATLRSVIDTLSEGRTATVKLTVPEGLTSHQIVERIKADQLLTGEIGVVPTEGTLLPETYVVPRGSSRQAVLDMLQVEQKKIVDRAWAERQEGLPFKTVEEAITMASVVERETGRNDERDRVAAVFVNRLRANMQLQSDPTILYGLFGGKVSWGKPILRTEIRSNTAHNTYVIKGLPPTPICNPGRAAIEAVLRPAQTKELYFVANGKGGHVFAETLADHNTNVKKYREFEQSQAQAKAAAAAGAPPVVVPAASGAAIVTPAAPVPQAPAVEVAPTVASPVTPPIASEPARAPATVGAKPKVK
jgi:UPF0755 protein